ncbi:Glycogen synthase [Thiorhodovibrio winogradskyi]|uniref:Glycogen synthase n=1 Tax=Thiorhodovibrio winogradskyi TaxID=77007 RepID=A0ABZ0SI56_9GAMM|nr:glycosyltransferase family 4 protein [Thiorhodovibrio winogradskyi]
MKFAYFGIPHTGGTYSVYRSLRKGLAEHGVDVSWLGVGPKAQAAMLDPRWQSDLSHGAVIAGDEENEREQARRLNRHLVEAGFDGVFVNVLSGRVATNAIRFLDPAVKRVMIVHTITLATYAAARAIRDHVHATVGVSPRIRDDLIHQYGFSADRTQAIANAVDLARFQAATRLPRQDGPLRLLSLGRIINSDKGIFWLPEILERLPADVGQLTIAGDGPDLAELKRRCARFGERVRFIGRVDAEQVPKVLASHDVFLFPSRFEGLPLSLVEAMAAGCVPVASRIKGVTETVVRSGENGLLFPIGDVQAAAQAIEQLHRDPDGLSRMSTAARESVIGRFDLSTMAQAYFSILETLVSKPTRIAAPYPIEHWRYPRGLKPGFRTYLPTDLKNWLRLLRERLA